MNYFILSMHLGSRCARNLLLLCSDTRHGRQAESERQLDIVEFSFAQDIIKHNKKLWFPGNKIQGNEGWLKTQDELENTVLHSAI